MKVELKNVCKYYERDGQKISILNDVNLTVNEGESVALLGPTGCGKSTLIYMIAGLRFPDSGAVLVDGKAVEKPGHDRVVMFQDSALFPWLTVLGNVEFGLRMMGMGKEERRQKSLEMLKMVHLSRFINAYPHELSGGMKQRTALARSLVMDPKILLMDEPFAALDAQTRNMLQTELSEICQKTKKTVILVTHNVREATFLADNVYEISARPGKIKASYPIRVPRPRREGDPPLVLIQNQIMASLKDEIEKVAKQEIDTDYHVSKTGSLTPIHKDLGSHI